MKIRSGFVSNSSSSSFICDLCGETRSGWDMSLNEAGMTQCEHGHTLCDEHYINGGDLSTDDKQKFLIKSYNNRINGYYKNKPEQQKEYYDAIKNVVNLNEDQLNSECNDFELNYSFPSEFCPICRLDNIQDDTILNYIIKKFNINKDKIKTEIKTKYKTLQDIE